MVKLSKHNFHWKEGSFYGYEKKRKYFKKILKYLGKKQIISVTGLRRVGKTVLLKQTINHLIKNKKIARKNILYFSFDEEKPSIDKLMKEYSASSGLDIDKEKIYVFLDEVQNLDNWQNQIKVYYDNHQNIKFIVSGSESLFINKKARESLAGRIYNIHVNVLDFKEFLIFQDKEQLFKEPAMFKEDIKKELLKYLKRNFIEVIDEDQESLKLYFESIINKVIYEDIPSLFPIENPGKLKAIIKTIYSNPGVRIVYNNLGDDLSLSSKTVEKYLFYLIESNLIKKVYNFSRNFLTSEKKLKRFYVTAPSFCFLNDDYQIGKIVENIVALDPRIKFFWNSPSKDEVDFIIEQDGEPLPLEVKYENNITKSNIKGLLNFMDQFNIKKGLVISKDDEGAKEITWNSTKRKIQFIPLWKWLLKL